MTLYCLIIPCCYILSWLVIFDLYCIPLCIIFHFPSSLHCVLGLLVCFGIINNAAKSVFPPFEGSRRVSLGICPGIDLAVMFHTGLLRFCLSGVPTNTNPPASLLSLNIIQVACLMGISVAVIKFPDTKQLSKSLL